MPLRIGGVSTTATAARASIDQTTGVATFDAGSGTTLADALADIAASLTADGADVAGEFALFQVGGSGTYYLLMSDGTVGVTANDVVVQLIGVNSISSINLNVADNFGQIGRAHV